MEGRPCQYNGGTCTRRGCAVECHASSLCGEVEALRQRPGAQAASEPVAKVFIKDGHWSRGHYIDRKTWHAEPLAGLEKLADGTLLYAAPAGERPAQADAPEALRQKFNHIEECADVWGVTGMSRFKAIKRTVEEMRVLLLVPEAAGERPGAQAPSTADVYLRVTRPEGYEDVHPELVVADMEIHPAFEVEVVAAPSTGGAETADADDAIPEVAAHMEQHAHLTPEQAKRAAVVALTLFSRDESSAPAQAVETAGVREELDAYKLVSLWFDEWELILPPDARQSFIDDLMLSVRRAAQSPAASPASKEDGSHE